MLKHSSVHCVAYMPQWMAHAVVGWFYIWL